MGSSAASLCALLAVGCAIDVSGLAGTPSGDAGGPIDASSLADRTLMPADAAPAVDGSMPRMDAGVPIEDAGTLSSDAGAPADAGVPAGTVLWQRTGPDYDPTDFEYTTNMHFEGQEIHVATMCRDLEMVTIADPASAGWTDYSVAVVRVRFDEVGCGSSRPSFTIVGRTVSTEPTCAGAAGYGCSIEFDDDRIRVGRRDGSCGWAAGSVTTGTGSINTGEQYELTLEIDGRNIRCTFRNGGDSASANTTDSSRTHTAGGVTFIFDDVDARFGDPTVTAL